MSSVLPGYAAQQAQDLQLPAGQPPAASCERSEPPEIVLRIEGKPEGTARGRFDPRTKRVYTPKNTQTAAREIRAAWEFAGQPRLPDDTAVAIEVVLVVRRPQGHFRKSGDLSTEGLRHPVPRNRKPDVDNALKLVMDALGSRAYSDDVRVARACVERVWGEWPATIVRLSTYSAPSPEQLELG